MKKSKKQRRKWGKEREKREEGEGKRNTVEVLGGIGN